jgi:subfamily B ATP-binding cassette protein MsbA
MNNIPILSTLVRYYRIYYRYAGCRLIVLLLLILGGGLTEGLGISLVVPLLGADAGGVSDNAYVGAVRALFAFLGLDLALGPLLAVMVATFLLKGVLVFSQEMLKAVVSTGMERDLRRLFSAKYAAMSYRYFTGVSIGHLNNLITTEIGRALSGLNNYLNLIVNLAYISVYVSLALTINAPLTLVALGLAIVAGFCLKRMTAVLEKNSLLVSKTNSEVQSLLIQFIHNYKYLKATNGFSALLGHLFGKIDENRRYSLKSVTLPQLTASLVEPLAVCGLAGLIWYYVGGQGKNMAEILVVLLFFHRAFLRIFESQNVWQRFSAYVGGILTVDRAAAELDANREAGGGLPVTVFEREIRLSDVSFAYDKAPVLSGVSLVIPKNACVGFVGHSGAGKTTLFDMLTGLIPPDSGELSLDGTRYAELDMATLRRLFGYVTQEPVIFNDTVANNISFWECDPSRPECLERIRRAAELANARGFIEEGGQGYGSVLGDKGVRLSGGQRQRVAIAREIFKDPPIMIFDEATSALDSESEAAIQQSIREMAGKRTLVIIAHRLSTVRECDVIYVLDKGRLVDRGRFDELHAKKGSLFHRMCQAQKL